MSGHPSPFATVIKYLRVGPLQMIDTWSTLLEAESPKDQTLALYWFLAGHIMEDDIMSGHRGETRATGHVVRQDRGCSSGVCSSDYSSITTYFIWGPIRTNAGPYKNHMNI